MELTILVGNPQAGSRTLRVAEAVGQRIAARSAACNTTVIDLAPYAGQLFEWESPAVQELNSKVAASSIVVVASPTYKASYTGLLKAFLDRYDTDGLAGVAAVPVMTAGAPHHAMGVEVFLRPLLVELGASVPTRGLCFLMSAIDELDSVVDKWAERNLPALSHLL